MFADYETTPRARGSTWTTVCVPRGTSICGVICGPIRIVLTHYNGECSKPCRREITKGAVRCYCEDPQPCGKRVYGYLPLMTRTEDRIVIPLCKSVSHAVKQWAHGTPVEIVAPMTEKTKTRCRQCPVHQIGERLVEKVKAAPPACIAEYLVYVLWHDQPVCDYFDAQLRKEDAAKFPRAVKPKKNKQLSPKQTTNNTTVDGLLQGIGLDPNAKA